MIQLPSQGFWRTRFWSTSWQPLGKKLISGYHLNLQRYWKLAQQTQSLKYHHWSIEISQQKLIKWQIRNNSCNSHNTSAICSILYTIFKALWPSVPDSPGPLTNLSRLHYPRIWCSQAWSHYFKQRHVPNFKGIPSRWWYRCKAHWDNNQGKPTYANSK